MDDMSYSLERLYSSLSKFDNGDYDEWFERNNAYEYAQKIRGRIIQELSRMYAEHPTDKPMPLLLLKAYQYYIRYYEF